jgi:hypothetical protein
LYSSPKRKEIAMEKQDFRFVYRPQTARYPRWLGRVLSWL